MTKIEILKELASLVRQSEDAARANDAEAAVFQEEYETLKDSRDQESAERISEIYDYLISRPTQARRLRKEADLFRAAIALIDRGSD